MKAEERGIGGELVAVKSLKSEAHLQVRERAKDKGWVKNPIPPQEVYVVASASGPSKYPFCPCLAVSVSSGARQMVVNQPN